MGPLTLAEIEAGIGSIYGSPRDAGTLEMIVRRPDVDAREVVEQAELSLVEGLVGDNWKPRGSKVMPDGSAHPDRQITLMNSRLIGLLAREREFWPLAGDQLYVDFDLSEENLPPGTQLAIGGAVLEATGLPHTGCSKFSARFGVDALQFISAPDRRALRLRGIYAKVVEPGIIHRGDRVQKK